MNFLSQNNNSFAPYTMNCFSDSSNASLYYLSDNGAQLRNSYQQAASNECLEYKNKGKNISNVWTKGSFHNRKLSTREINLTVRANKMSWSNQNNNNNNNSNNNNNKNVLKEEKAGDRGDEQGNGSFETVRVASPTPEGEIVSPSHHARRPMNAFLIFCKKHRPVVRKKYPNLENRGVTRILGEWWALLDTTDKDPYKSLAKEYKDAFFSANPDFKWYKLPAPPLRTLSTRPASTQKEPTPLENPAHTSPFESEFTPGKLADESQLGMLSSLLNVNNYSNKTAEFEHKTSLSVPHELNIVNKEECCYNNSESSDKHVPLLESPPNATRTTSLPPKPLKKRIFIEHRSDNKDISRNIFNTYKSNADISNTYDNQEDISKLSEQQNLEIQTEINIMELNNVTKQELVDKVVDSMFPDKNQNCAVPKNGLSSTRLVGKETRKSGRSCKGKLYAEFMVNGKLIKNKRDKRLSTSEISKRIENELTTKVENKVDVTPKLDLEQTIKRLAERTHVNLDKIDQKLVKQGEDTACTHVSSETSNDSLAKNASNKFNLELRISELPSLNYETYIQRKRESKKRKFTKTKSNSSETKCKLPTLVTVNNKSVTGSKKRKNKQNITHLEKADSQFENSFSDLSGLATLAEIAANKEKINQS